MKPRAPDAPPTASAPETTAPAATETRTAPPAETTTTATEEHDMTPTETTTTAPTGASNREDRATMESVDQTNPYTNTTFGFAVYGRGVAADGGHEESEESMEDVDHESGTDGADRTFERGKDSDEE